MRLNETMATQVDEQAARMKVLLADDHWIVRDSLKHAMRSVGPSIETLEASNFDEALKLLDENPDISLMLIDLIMPGFTEFNGLRMLRSRFPDIPIAVISVHEEREYVLRAIEEGVIGYIPKSSGGTEVLQALTLVLDGGVSFPRRILQGADKPTLDAASPPSRPQPAEQPEHALTPREKEVHGLAASGRSNAEIADELGMSPNTVRVHLRNISLKLGADDGGRPPGVASLSRRKHS